MVLWQQLLATQAADHKIWFWMNSDAPKDGNVMNLCEIFLKCVWLRIYIIYIYICIYIRTVHYTNLYTFTYIFIVYSIIPWKPIDDGVRWRRGPPPKPSCWSKLREIWVVFDGNSLWKSWRLFMVVFYFTLKFPLNPKERNIKITWNPIKSDDLGGFTFAEIVG